MGDGAKLKQILEIEGRNIREIAKKTDLTASTLYTIVKRDTSIKVGMAMKLAEELNISPTTICEEFPFELEEAMKKYKRTVINKPVTVGDTVYLVYLEEDINGTSDLINVQKTTVTDIWVNRGFTLSCYGEENEVFCYRTWEDIGEKVFLTREDAFDYIEENYEFPYNIYYKQG